MIDDILSASSVLPLIQSDDPQIAVDIAAVLEAGGIKVIEVVLRTDNALDCLEAIVRDRPNLIVGVGTVLNRDQVEMAAERGAKFIVSPGLDESVVESAKALSLSVFPGVMTPSECQRAANLGLRAVKFFPANLAGGAPMLKALSAVFRNMSFIPTGGVSAENLEEFLSIGPVVACGGSWLTPADKIAAGDFDAVTRLAAQALSLAKRARL